MLYHASTSPLNLDPYALAIELDSSTLRKDHKVLALTYIVASFKTADYSICNFSDSEKYSSQ